MEINHLARAFVRKYPATEDVPFSKTVIVMVVAGDVEGFTDEALHDCKVVDLSFMGGAITLDVTDREPQPHLEGWDIADILSDGMSGPLR